MALRGCSQPVFRASKDEESFKKAFARLDKAKEVLETLCSQDRAAVAALHQVLQAEAGESRSQDEHLHIGFMWIYMDLYRGYHGFFVVGSLFAACKVVVS